MKNQNTIKTEDNNDMIEVRCSYCNEIIPIIKEHYMNERLIIHTGCTDKAIFNHEIE